jgi:acylphosphatase
VPDLIRTRVIVAGRVQGVFFRDSCRELARAEHVAGHCRNLMDGTLEAVFEGPPAAVERMVAWCRTGPPRALVERVDVFAEEPVGEGGFRIS